MPVAMSSNEALLEPVLGNPPPLEDTVVVEPRVVVGPSEATLVVVVERSVTVGSVMTGCVVLVVLLVLVLVLLELLLLVLESHFSGTYKSWYQVAPPGTPFPHGPTASAVTKIASIPSGHWKSAAESSGRV